MRSSSCVYLCGRSIGLGAPIPITSLGRDRAARKIDVVDVVSAIESEIGCASRADHRAPFGANGEVIVHVAVKDEIERDVVAIDDVEQLSIVFDPMGRMIAAAARAKQPIMEGQNHEL